MGNSAEHGRRKARTREQGKGTKTLSFQQHCTLTLASLLVKPQAEDLLWSNNSSAEPFMKCNLVLPCRICISLISSSKHHTYLVTI